MDVHQCPRCELRFTTRAEQIDHLVRDHGVEPHSLESGPWVRDRRGALPEAPDARRCLVVANRTIGSDALTAAVEDRVAAGVRRFLVVVPATPEESGPGSLAEGRLRRALEIVSAMGYEAVGQVGVEDPEAAVRDVLQAHHVDEILVAMLPSGASRWLGIDLPGRLRHRYALPVTTVTASVGDPHGVTPAPRR